MTPEALTEFLHLHIPLTALAQLRVTEYAAQRIELRAPLTINRNHHGSAFGGSLAMLSVATGWSLVHSALEDAGLATKLVVAKSELEFIAPAVGELVSTGSLNPTDWQALIDALASKGRGKIPVETEVRVDGVLAVKHRALFVAHLQTL